MSVRFAAILLTQCVFAHLFLTVPFLAPLHGMEPLPEQANPTAFKSCADPLPRGVRARLGIARTPNMDTHTGPIVLVSYSRDGARLATLGADEWYRTWDIATGTVIQQLERASHRPSGTALSPDWHYLAVPGWRETFYLREVSTGKIEGRGGTDHGAASALIFSSDGKVVLSYSSDVICLWEMESGKKLGQFTIRGDHSHLALSPDGRLLAVQVRFRRDFGRDPDEILIWDAASGKHVRTLTARNGSFTAFAFSPDSRFLAAATWGRGLYLWSAGTGEEVAFAETPANKIRSMAFSASGRKLALGGDNGDAHVWELSTFEEQCVFRGDQGTIATLAFSPNERTLATGGHDTTVLLWDSLSLTGTPSAAPFSANELVGHWEKLRERNAPGAYVAMQALATAQEALVPFLRERLKPVRELPPRQVKKLLASLDSEQFLVRQDATAELEREGERVIAALRKAIEGRTSPEVRNRLEMLLQEKPLSAETLRQIRAVEILEYIGTPEARKLLEELAGGTDGARVTRQAKAALQRLARPDVAGPRQ